MPWRSLTSESTVKPKKLRAAPSVKRALRRISSPKAHIGMETAPLLSEYVWACDVCQQPLAAESNSQFISHGDSHITKAHPGVPRDKFHVLYEPTGVISASKIFLGRQEVGSVLCVRPAWHLLPIDIRKKLVWQPISASAPKFLSKIAMRQPTAGPLSLNMGDRPRFVRVLKPRYGGMKAVNLTLYKVASQFRELHELQRATNHTLQRVETQQRYWSCQSHRSERGLHLCHLSSNLEMGNVPQN